MFEADGVLLTWAASELPAIGGSVTGERLADHRLMYLDYEGPVLGDRGRVQRMDGGQFEWLETTPTRYLAKINGEKLRGQLLVEKTAEDQRWRITLSG
jgi:hypothetical protein